MRIVHFVPIFSTANAGILSATRSLAAAQRRAGAHAELWVIGSRNAPQSKWADKTYDSAATLRRHLDATVSLFHLHGLWTLSGASCTADCRARTIPYVVSPHGMLMPRALRVKAWKKVPYWYAVERRVVRGARLLHATSEIERKGIAAMGLSRPIVVVPHGAPTPPDLPSLHDHAGDYVLFLGRIHPIKNLEVLLSTRPATKRPLRLLIAGDGSPRYTRYLRRLADRNDHLSVHFIGWLSGADKWRVLSSARALVLPSLSENFGNVVLEALSVGTPVIASRATPWGCLETTGAGLWVDPTREALELALSEASSPAWQLRRAAARECAQQFSWDSLASEMLRMYANAIQQA